jgi:MFS family permease
VVSRTGSPRLPLLIGGLSLMLSTYLMARLSGSTAETHLLVTFGLFGVGMGLVNSQISVAAVAGMPTSQAGLASGIASASRQVGQALGVAVSGSLLTARAHGRMHSGFILTSPLAWHLLFWCASAVVISGLLTTRARARHAMARAPFRRRRLPAQRVSAHPQSPAPPLPRRTPPSPGDSVWAPRRPINREAPGDPALESVFPRDRADS